MLIANDKIGMGQTGICGLPHTVYGGLLHTDFEVYVAVLGKGIVEVCIGWRLVIVWVAFISFSFVIVNNFVSLWHLIGRTRC